MSSDRSSGPDAHRSFQAMALPTLAPAPRWVPVSIQGQLLLQGFAPASMLGILGAILLTIFAYAFWGIEDTYWPGVVMIGLAAVCLILSAAGFRSWRRSVGVLSRGELAWATITASQTKAVSAGRGRKKITGLEWQDFEDRVEAINRWVAEHGWDSLGRGGSAKALCRFEFALPDGRVGKAKAEVDFRVRYALHALAATDIAVYDPHDPKRAVLLTSFRPPLNVSHLGKWKRGQGQIDFTELLSSVSDGRTDR